MSGNHTRIGAQRSSLTLVAPLVPLLIVGLLASRGIRDNSFIWHIRAGEAQMVGGRVLTEDIFSFTRFGAPWRTQSWLLELGYSIVESTVGGLAWANWMVMIVGSSVLALIGLAVYRSIGSVIVVSFTMVLSVWLLGPFLLPRPVIFSYLLLALLVVALGDVRRLGWTAIPLVWVWSAVHGSWIVGIALIGLESLRTRNRRLIAISVVALGATLVTAHGVGTWMIILDFLESREALSMMQEWMPPAPQDIVQLPYLLLIAGIVVAGVRGRIEVRDLVVLFPFLLFGLSSRRAVLPAAIVLLPWAVQCLPVPRPAQPSISRFVVRGIGATIVVLAVIPMIVSPLGTLDATRFPSDAVLAALDDGPSFHSMAAGGYMIYAGWPDRRVYIDDRAELHGAAGIAEYEAIVSGAYVDAFARWGIASAIVDRRWPLADVLARDGWQVRAEDGLFIVLRRP